MSKVLFIDLETYPQLGYTWTSYEANVLHVVKPWIICCFTAKWLGGDRITKALPDYKAKDDRLLVKDLWNLVNQADVLVAHNGDSFDVRKMNSRFIAHGFLPPHPYHTIDTKKVARRVFGFTSNRLDTLCQQLGLGKKLSTDGFDLWLGCIEGDEKAWAKMRAYNSHDVALLEKLYLKMLPWINNHPLVADAGCPKCGSAHLQSRGTRRTSTRTYSQLQCQDCGGWVRIPKSISSAKYVNA